MSQAKNPTQTSTLNLSLCSVTHKNKIHPFLIHNLFLKEVNNLKTYLSETQKKCDSFDAAFPSRKLRVQQVLNIRTTFFNKIKKHFSNIWSAYQTLPKDLIKAHTKFFRLTVWDLMLNAEINNHIVRQPYGYAGDHEAIEYLYTYSGAFLGQSTYTILLNDYTTSTPIAESTTQRKDYFKHKLLTLLNNNDTLNVLSLGSGAAQELIELIEEVGIHKNLTFTCVDFDERTFNRIQSSLNKLPYEKRPGLALKFSKLDIKDCLNKKKLMLLFGKQDFIYSAGLYDYFNDKAIKTITKTYFDLLSEKGTMMVCNVSDEHPYYRDYYELLGNWVFFHRIKEEFDSLLSSVSACRRFINTEAGHSSHIYLELSKG